jgi:hypothetical protein
MPTRFEGGDRGQVHWTCGLGSRNRGAGVRATFPLYSVPVDVSHDVRGMDKEKDEVYHRRVRSNTASAASRRRPVVLWLSSFSTKSSVYFPCAPVLTLTPSRYDGVVWLLAVAIIRNL